MLGRQSVSNLVPANSVDGLSSNHSKESQLGLHQVTIRPVGNDVVLHYLFIRNLFYNSRRILFKLDSHSLLSDRTADTTRTALQLHTALISHAVLNTFFSDFKVSSFRYVLWSIEANKSEYFIEFINTYPEIRWLLEYQAVLDCHQVQGHR